MSASSVLRWVRFILPIIAVLAAASALNAWVLRYPLRLDLTNAGVYTMSSATRAVIESIRKPVAVTFFYDTRSRAMQDARFLLEQYAAESERIEVRSHDPLLEPAMAERFGVRFAGTAIFASDGREVVVNSPNETEFSNALLRVTSDAVGRLCFTDGHVESNPFSLQSHDHFERSGNGHEHGSDGGRPLTLHERHGMGMARNALNTLGYTVEQRTPSIDGRSLRDCNVVIIASPQIPFTQQEVVQLVSYLATGGAVFALLEPGVNHNLESVLTSFGATLSHTGIEDIKRHYWTDVATPAVSDYPRHRVSRHLALTFFPGVAEVSPHPNGIPEEVRVTPLVESSEESILSGEDASAGAPRTIGMLASDKRSGAKIALFGDGDFATNSFFSALGNGQLFLNVVSELAGQDDLVDITPRNYAVATMRLSNEQLRLSFLLTTIAGPLILLAIGLLIWRRRK
jgi:hypothetical protein